MNESPQDRRLSEQLDSPLKAKLKAMGEAADAFLERIIRTRWFGYLYTLGLLLYLLLCGYILFFSGSLFIESVFKGWWRPDASDFDQTSFLLGYLYGFPSLLGVVGGILVLASNVERFYRYKILMFVPSVVWAGLLVLDILRRPLSAWVHMTYHLPILLICVMVLYAVVKKVRLPYHA